MPTIIYSLGKCNTEEEEKSGYLNNIAQGQLPSRTPFELKCISPYFHLSIYIYILKTEQY